MHIEKLDENQIRIFLDIYDLKSKNVDLHSFMSNNSEAQNLISELLDIAENQVGFKPGNSSLAIEALACLNGKFVLTITKISSESIYSSKIPNQNFLPKDSKPYIFAFNSFDDFCDFCNYIYTSFNNTYLNFLKNCSLVLLGNIYYLVLNSNCLDIPNYNDFNLNIYEFASFVKNENFIENKLREFGKVIINASKIN